MRKVVFIIDGWFMRKKIYELKSFYYDGTHIREYCLKHLRKEDHLYRIFYYDTMPLMMKGHHPITKKLIDFSNTPVAKKQVKLLESIKQTPNFALRLGKTSWKLNSWALKPEKFKALLDKKIGVEDLEEKDIQPIIEQKTVDMKMGIDIALISTKKLADLLIIITGDADMVPALKLARREGMQVGLDPLTNYIKPDLREHVDFIISKVGNKSLKDGKN